MKIGPELSRDKISMISLGQPYSNAAIRIRAWEGSRGYLSMSWPSGVMVVGEEMAPSPANVWKAAATDDQQKITMGFVTTHLGPALDYR